MHLYKLDKTKKSAAALLSLKFILILIYLKMVSVFSVVQKVIQIHGTVFLRNRLLHLFDAIGDEIQRHQGSNPVRHSGNRQKHDERPLRTEGIDDQNDAERRHQHGKNQIQPPGGNAEPTVIQRVLNQKEVAHDKNDPEDKRKCRSDLRRTGQKENAEQDLDGAFDKPKGFVTVNKIIDDAEQSPREHDTAEKITDRHLCHRGNHQQADSEHNIEDRFDKGSYL